MLHLLELILGLPSGFLSQQGEFTLQFNPIWPLQDLVGGAAAWNCLLGFLTLALVVYVYRQEGRSRAIRIALGVLRLALLGLILILLNRPALTLGHVRREPSVLAILIDDSLSMKVKDAVGPDGKPLARIDAVISLLTSRDADLLRRLSAVHDLHVYEFDRGRHELANISSQPGGSTTRPSADSSVEHEASVSRAALEISQIKPQGDATQIIPSLRTVLEDLQGKRVAGVALLTDGRETPNESTGDAIAAVKSFGVNIYPISVGSDQMPRNIAIESVNYEPSAFVDDITNFKISVRASGYEPNHPLTLMLERQQVQNGQVVRTPVIDENGKPIAKTVTAVDDHPFGVELQFKPTKADMPMVNLIVEAQKQEGELDTDDNTRKIQLAVLDDHVTVLYVDGAPRWDYRYLKTSMLRDKTIKISCLLTSADPAFAQEGSVDDDRPGKTWAINAFPTSMEQLLDYDVVIFGDVDPRQFSDAQLQMVSDFVSKKGGGFEMVAGPRWSPQAYRNTPIEPVLPVIISHVQTDDPRSSNNTGFRIVLTPAGQDSSIFRFFPDAAENAQYLKNQMQELFWYCRGIMAKPGVGVTFAEHPIDLGPDNRKAPILVAGRFGEGRTMFSAIDDSWRWRYYTGESVFNTYWIEQIRHLARGRKVGQHKLTLSADQEVYELGKQVKMQVNVLSPELMPRISSPTSVEIDEDATGQPVRKVEVVRQEGSEDVLSGSFTADRIGQFTAKLSTPTGDDLSVSYKVESPRLEMADPRVDAGFLSRLATDGVLSLSDASGRLLGIRGMAKMIPEPTTQPLWNAPLAMIAFVTLITLEWILRKSFGML